MHLLLINGREQDETYDSYHNHYGYYGYEPKVSELVLPARAYPEVLPKLCATGRLLWMLDSYQQVPEADGRAVVWEGGSPWRFRLCIQADDEKSAGSWPGNWSAARRKRRFP